MATAPSDPADGPPSGERLEIGRVGRAHGIHGAVRIRCAPEHVAALRGLPVIHLDGRSFQVRGVRGTDDAPILDLDGVSDRTAAEQLTGAVASLVRTDLVEVDEDEYRHDDLLGCEVCDSHGLIGTISRVESYPANDVLTVARADGGRDVLVPFIKDAVLEVDVDGRRIVVDGEFLGIREGQ